jgi:lysine 2,3-aminomutase
MSFEGRPGVTREGRGPAAPVVAGIAKSWEILGKVCMSALPLPMVSELPPLAKKPPSEPGTLAHRELRGGLWWHTVPAYRAVDEATFLDHSWQAKNSITKVSKLVETIQELVPAGFVEDLEAGMKRAPMSLRVSPYIVSLIDWERPYDDPLRTQFFPLASRLLPDHPKLGLDSLAEQADAPVPGLTHRYTDKALFLPLDTCPVYCRFCTRSYAIGLDTHEVEKVRLRPNEDRWRRAYQYIASRPELEDIVVSGGDAYQLRAQHLEEIGEALLAIPNVRRMRFATKGPAVMPMKILTDDAWLDALTRVVDKGRRVHKDVVLHTHFNSPSEITGITEAAMGRLFERGIVVRNQSVLIRGVNDSVETMTLLVRRLGYLNVHAYYVYVHDMVQGVEDLRTSVDTAILIEKHVRGSTAGFNTPTFVVDAPGGGGKRDAHSHEYYDRDTGVSVYAAPSVKPGQLFMYFDPLHQLATHQQRRWADPVEQEAMMQDALAKARGRAR